MQASRKRDRIEEILLYGSTPLPLNLFEIRDYVCSLLGFEEKDVKVMGDFISLYLQKNRLEWFAQRVAGAKVRNLNSQLSKEGAISPLPAEIEFEKNLILSKSKAIGILYDAFLLNALLRDLLPEKERSMNEIHLLFMNRLFGTFDENDLRYHARVILCSFPSMISIPGLIEAPAKPREYYVLRQYLSSVGLNDIERLKEKFKGRFIDYGSPHITETLKGYVLQAVVYHLTGEAFCQNRNCRLFNAHWQEEVINAQLQGDRFCHHHRRLLERIKKEKRLLWM